jgi:hypothetical protein
MIAGLMMNIDQLKAGDGIPNEQGRLISDSRAILENLNKEVRTISRLLHPTG